MRRAFRIAICFMSILSLAASCVAREVKVPPGTLVYGELDERVTSRIEKDGWDQGDVVRAHVWRDVVVDGATVIKAGTPMLVRIDTIKKAKMAGVKGKLELEAVSTTTVDDQQIALSGGYDKSGHSRMGLSISLAAVVAWPLIFIKGKAAILDAGTVFDATTEAPLEIQLEQDAPRKVRISRASLEAEVLYDEMDPSGKSKVLPLRLTDCDAGLGAAAVSSVNGKAIEPIPVVLGTVSSEGDCATAPGSIDLQRLGKHFGKGINRFDVSSGDASTEIVLDIEL